MNEALRILPALGSGAFPLKVCCIQNAAEAALATELGAAALGLVSAMPSGPGVIDDARIAEICTQVSAEMLTVLLTSRTEAAGILEQLHGTGARAIQICSAVEASVHRALRDALPRLVIIQVIHVEGPESVDEALTNAGRPEVDALLLDSGRPGAAVPELGGTGRLHDWAHSAQICRLSRVPVFLAGGLRPDNLRIALETVRPFGIDICSGVRTNGDLDRTKLKALTDVFRQIRAEAGPV